MVAGVWKATNIGYYSPEATVGKYPEVSPWSLLQLKIQITFSVY